MFEGPCEAAVLYLEYKHWSGHLINLLIGTRVDPYTLPMIDRVTDRLSGSLLRIPPTAGTRARKDAAMEAHSTDHC